MNLESSHGHGRFMQDIANSRPALGIAFTF
jgi:hypothetical protein